MRKLKGFSSSVDIKLHLFKCFTTVKTKVIYYTRVIDGGDKNIRNTFDSCSKNFIIGIKKESHL